MAEQIYKGVDCCRDALHPTRRPKVYPAKKQMQYNSALNLYIKTVWPECFDSCFKWHLIAGGGFLDPEVGINTIYHSPRENERCEQNPMILVTCGAYRLELFYIAVNRHGLGYLAYFDVGDWKEGYIVEDGTPRDRVPPHQTHFGLKPSYGTVTIRLRDCTGALLETMHTGIIQTPHSWGSPEYGLVHNHWNDFFIRDKEPHWTRGYGYTYDRAKQLNMREKLPGKVDTRVPKGEDWKEWLPWLVLWPDEHYPYLGEPFDVRNKGMIDKGCCAFDLLPAIEEEK